MGFLKNLFKSSTNEDQSLATNESFWKWFQENEKQFYNAIKEQKDVSEKFLDKLFPELNKLRDGYFFLAGMQDDDTAELIITAEGVLKNIVFVEELIADAPKLPNWKFTALKKASEKSGYEIRMDHFHFTESNIFFYANEDPTYPDNVDLTFVFEGYNEENQKEISQGILIFIDNLLGELRAVTTIDYVDFKSTEEAEKELIPITKLPSFLTWREKEFVEKYEGIRYESKEDSFSALEATLQNGNPLIAIINQDLLEWDRKASHSYILNLQIEYEQIENGLPSEDEYELLNHIEDVVLEQMKAKHGFLYIGRETANGKREIFIACKDFRKASKKISSIKEKYEDILHFDYSIYRDKYWISFERYQA
ncbi:MAG: DUF695 domain-containing protein [Flavobacteriales bacterium]|jgi:hypothetical protein|nr:DUF695 domain-containing protein [Flavobacteriales bacterium]